MVKKKKKQCKRPGFNPLVGKISWRREWLQYSCLKYSMDREDWQAIVHGAAKSDKTWRMNNSKP